MTVPNLRSAARVSAAALLGLLGAFGPAAGAGPKPAGRPRTAPGAGVPRPRTSEENGR